MATEHDERLFHNWQAWMDVGWLCAKCGARANTWDEVDQISMGPCVDDDDPCVVRHQALMDTEVAIMWKKLRGEKEAAYKSTKAKAKPVWSLGDKARFNCWLNGSDPVLDLDWSS